MKQILWRCSALLLAAFVPAFFYADAAGGVSAEPPADDSSIIDYTPEVPSASVTDSSHNYPRKIVEINYCGNRVTKPWILRLYLGIDTGMAYDSTIIAAGKKRLMDTYLFSKVEVLRLQKPDGIHVWILVTEFFYWGPGGGGDIVTGRYGDSKQIWYRLHLGLTLQNFRGVFETFSVGATFWDDKALSISWSKPLGPSSYYFGISAAAEEYPDLSFPRRRVLINGRVTVGKRFLDNSRTYLSMAPTYNGITRIDSTDVPGSRVSYEEVVTQWGWVTDRRDRSFDPTSGWHVHTSLGTNALYAGKSNAYLQWSSDLKLYHHGFFSSDRFAYRLITVFRTNDGGPYRAVYIGGDGSIRGWARDDIGRSTVMNDYVVISGEYRFPVIRSTPPFDIPILSDQAPSLKGFYLRTDGAVILDAGTIWKNLTQPFAVHENGEGVGIGLRILAPTLLRSVCFDVVWPFRMQAKPFKVGYYSWIPGWSLYLDMYY
jgi:outer membrane protein assembly factor BamA